MEAQSHIFYLFHGRLKYNNNIPCHAIHHSIRVLPKLWRNACPSHYPSSPQALHRDYTAQHQTQKNRYHNIKQLDLWFLLLFLCRKGPFGEKKKLLWTDGSHSQMHRFRFHMPLRMIYFSMIQIHSKETSLLMRYMTWPSIHPFRTERLQACNTTIMTK